MKQAAACLVTCQADRDYLLKNDLASRTYVVPNVVAMNGWGGQDYSREVLPVILFCGQLSYPPNEEGVIFFCKKVLPRIREVRPDVQLMVVGQNPTQKVLELGHSPGVLVKGSVPSTEPFYRQAVLTVVPLLHGGGTRIKILEAMILHTPVVSTSIGCEGLEVVDGEHLLIADDPEVFAQRCLQLLENPHARATLARNAYRLVKDRYDIEVLYQRMDACLSAILGQDVSVAS